MKTQKLTVLEKIGFGSGDMAINVVISSMFLIINYFYTDVFGLKPAHLALMFPLVRIIDAVTDPAMGILTDKLKGRHGRYRPYLLYLAVPFGIAVFLTFTTPDFAYAGKLVWAYATYIFVTLMFTGVTIPYISLISVLTDDPKERLSANGYRLFLAKVAAFLVAIAVPKLAQIWGAESMQRGYQLAMGLMALLSVFFLLFCFITTRERVEHVVDRKPLAEQWKILFRNDQWVVLCIVCVVGTVGYTIRNSVAAYYAQYYLGDKGLIAPFLGTGVGAAILAMVASTWITKRYCKVQMFRWTQLAVGVISLAMLLLVGPGDVVTAFVFYALLSFVVDLHAPVFWSAIAEAVDYGQAKTGQRVSGIAFGGISFCQKTGMAVAGSLANILLTVFHYVPDVPQSSYTLTGIALMVTIIPGAFHAIMGWVMFKYRITDAFYNRMKEGREPGLQPMAGVIHDTTI
ncbi:MAG: MFS transporter [Verrucomicrobiota bacterium JB022]|nr:MFS transporter [Verrucomicrobiota bacterium JB022]